MGGPGNGEDGGDRQPGSFLSGNGLLTPADPDEAGQVAGQSQRAGICGQARLRLKYRPEAT